MEPVGGERRRDSAGRDELFTAYFHLVERVARRFEGRGEPLDDLRQVASIGLLHAIDRFDPDRRVPFGAFAVATMAGDIKRHFRDTGWTVRAPRSVQEVSREVQRAVEELNHRLGRSPTIKEIAAHSGLNFDRVVEGLGAASAYQPASLDVAESSPSPVGSDLVDGGFEEVIDELVSIAPAVARLTSREQQVLVLRFFHDLSQRQIAERIGISQMHVSRLLSRALASLREEMAEDG